MRHRGDLLFLVHNVVFHPLAGLCWVLGWDRLGDALHGLGEPS